MSPPAPATPPSPSRRALSKVTASDITDQMLAEAKKLAALRGLGNVRTARAKAEDLPFPDMSFDLVTCRLAAHHFDKPRAFVAEAHRVLMPNGVLAVVDNISPDGELIPALSPARCLTSLAKAYNAFEKLRDPSHGRCLGLAEWTKLLGENGFTVEHKEHMDQDIEFAPWTARMRCDTPTVARLKAPACRGAAAQLPQAARERQGSRLHPARGDHRGAEARLSRMFSKKIRKAPA